MLERIIIDHFAIIDHVEIEFNHGMNVLLGETGAGKSIIIDAIGQLLGQRANVNMIQNHEDKAFIEGHFYLHDDHAIKDLLNEAGIEDDEQLIVSKEIHRDGKAVCRLNYRVVSNALLKRIVPFLVDIHSQFDNQDLLDEKKHIHFIDQYCQTELEPLKEEYTVLYQNYISKKKEYLHMLNEELDVEQIEYYQACVQEIEDAHLIQGEEEELEAEKKKMQNFEKINDKVQLITHLMDDEGTLSALQSVSKALEQLSDDQDFQEIYDQYMDLYYQLVDNYESLLNVYRHLNYDEKRLDEIQERLFLINKLYRKYGFSIERVEEARNKMLEKIALIEHRDEYLSQAKIEVSELEKKALDQAKKMHLVRQKAALKLEKELMHHFHDLYMPQCVFKVIIENVDLNVHGIDKITFNISTNKGQKLLPLSKIASGGEMSRIMLAIKCTTVSSSSLDTIIFDEVDTGVSGKVASAIGAKMNLLSNHLQVICVTHLPQVAAYATHHYYVSKKISHEKTLTQVELLDEQQSVYEIAKMLSDDSVSQEAINNARKLLQKKV